MLEVRCLKRAALKDNIEQDNIELRDNILRSEPLQTAFDLSLVIPAEASMNIPFCTLAL